MTRIDIKEILYQTFRGKDSAQIKEAEDKLLFLQDNNADFPFLVFQVITSDDVVNTQLCKSGIIQLVLYFRKHPNTIIQNEIPIFIQLSSIVSIDFHSILEFLSDEIAEFCIENNFVVELLENISKLFDEEKVLQALMLLNSLVSQNKTELGIFHQNIDYIYQKASNVLINIINNQSQNNLTNVITHYFIISFIPHFLNYLPNPQNLIPYVNLAMNIIQLNNSENPEIIEDSLELILNSIIISPELVNIQQLIHTLYGYFQKPSYKGITIFYNIFKVILTNKALVENISENLISIFKELFLPVFILNDNDQMNFEDDPERFIEDNYASYTEDDTPKSAAAACLYECSQQFNEISKIIFDSIINLFSNNIWENYSLVLFFSTVLSVFPQGNQAFERFASEIIKLISSNNITLICIGLTFLMNFPANYSSISHDIISSCLTLLANSNSPMIQYLASCAVSNLISINDFDGSQISKELLKTAFTNLFICSKSFPNERIAKSVSVFISSFSDSLSLLSENCLLTLLELFEGYMNDESIDARKSASQFSESIYSICFKIENQEVINYILENVNRFIENGYSINYGQELLQIINGCVLNSKILTDNVIMIPKILYDFFNGENREESIQISEIFKNLILKFKSELPLDLTVEPIFEIIRELLTDLTYDDYFALITFSQIVFIIYSNLEDSHQFLFEIIEQISELDFQFIGDISAAMISCEPMKVLENENLLNQWLFNSRTKAFIQSANVILQNKSIVSQELLEKIQTVYQDKIQQLDADQDFECEENIDLLQQNI